MDEKTPLLSNQLYDTLRGLVELVIPGIGTLYAAIAILWGLPYAEQVVGTAAALSVFGGVLLKVSRSQYKSTEADKDGSIDVFSTDGDTQLGKLSFNVSSEDIAGKNTLVLKVNNLNN